MPSVWNSTLARRTPLRASKGLERKKSLKRSGFERKPAKPMKRTPLAKQSRKQKNRLSCYLRISGKWAKKPENAFCGVCLSVSLNRPWPAVKADLIAGKAADLASAGGVLTPGTETHHARGRNGRLMSDTRFFIRTCRGCREVAHNRPLAEPLQLIYPRALFDVPAGDDEAGFPGS